MATATAVISSERWLDEVILAATFPADSASSPMSESVALPVTLGDVAILSLQLRAKTVDVGPAAASSVPRGARAVIVSSDGAAIVDVVGSAPWYLVNDTATALEYWCTLDPDALTLWRQNETLWVMSPEIDSDATPTGDMFATIKVVRVPAIRGQEVRRPIKLVR